MARVLLILSIVLTLATVGLGFVAKQKVDGLQTDLQNKGRELNATKNTLSKTKADLDASKKSEEAAKAAADAAKADLAKAQEEMRTAQTKLAEATAAVEQKSKELADLKSKLPDTPGTDIAAQLEKMQADLRQAQTEL